MSRFRVRTTIRIVVSVVADVARLRFLMLHSHSKLAAENLFLRNQFALYLERQTKPRRADDARHVPPQDRQDRGGLPGEARLSRMPRLSEGR